MTRQLALCRIQLLLVMSLPVLLVSLVPAVLQVIPSNTKVKARSNRTEHFVPKARQSVIIMHATESDERIVIPFIDHEQCN